MYEYQDDGEAWLRDRTRGMLGDDPGLGKSKQALRGRRGDRVLVTAPAMVIDGGVWADEVAKWAPEAEVTLVSYTSVCEREKTDAGGTRPLPRLRPEYRGRYDVWIADEVHHCKGRNTTWTKALDRVDCGQRILLTGTAIPNWAYEIYTPVRWLHEPGDRRYSSFWRWARGWFDVDKSWHGGLSIGGLKACSPACAHIRLPEVCDHWKEFDAYNLEGVFLRRLREDHLTELPPLTEQWVACPMPDKQRRFYQAMKKDYMAWTEGGMEVVAWNSAAQFVKLAKATSGIEVIDPASPSSGKLSALAELLEERRHSPTLVVAYFGATLAAIRGLLVKAGIPHHMVTKDTSKAARSRIIRSFQAGEFPILVGSVEVVGEGLTLTRADTVIQVERSYRPSRNEQVKRRVHRIGQVRPVSVIQLFTPDSVDDRIRKLLETKTDQQMKAMRPRELASLL